MSEAHVDTDRDHGADQQDLQHEVVQGPQEEFIEGGSLLRSRVVTAEVSFSFGEIHGGEPSVQVAVQLLGESFEA